MVTKINFNYRVLPHNVCIFCWSLTPADSVDFKRPVSVYPPKSKGPVIIYVGGGGGGNFLVLV